MPVVKMFTQIVINLTSVRFNVTRSHHFLAPPPLVFLSHSLDDFFLPQSLLSFVSILPSSSHSLWCCVVCDAFYNIKGIDRAIRLLALFPL